MFWKKHRRERKQENAAIARDDSISQPSEVDEVESWFTQQVEQCSSEVAKQITLKTHDEEKTQDIMQEAYKRLWATVQSYPDPLHQVRNFKGLLFTTANHIFIDEYRKKKHEPFIEFIHTSEWDDHYIKEGSKYDEPEVACEDKEAQGEIALALRSRIDQLPPRLRKVAVLAIMHELTPSEIAARLNKPVASVRTEISQVKQHLRITWGDDPRLRKDQ